MGVGGRGGIQSGGPISAAWGREVDRLARRHINNGVQCVESADGFQQIPDASRDDGVLMMVVCKGPNNENAPTNENYYLQRIDITAKDTDKQDDATVDNEVELREPTADIVLGFNLEEVWTHTHAVRTGTVVVAYLRYDLDRQPRWVFCVRPFLMTALFGGPFSAYGCQPCQGVALHYVDHWSERTPVQPYRHDPTMGASRDYAYFRGTHWIAGEFSLPDPENPETTVGYCLARWDATTSDWVGVPISSGTGGSGRVLYVWNDHLYFGCEGGTGVGAQSDDLVEIDFDPLTSTVTVSDIGWHANVGSEAVPYQIVVANFDKTVHTLKPNTLPTGGQYTLDLYNVVSGETVTTESLSYDATKEEVQAAIRLVQDEDAVVTGSLEPAEGLKIEFRGELYRGVTLPSTTADAELLDGGVTVATTTDVVSRGGEQLYVVGKFAAPQPDEAGPHLARWNGTTWSFLGDCASQYYDCLYDVCVHDFEDEDGEKLVVCGEFTQIGALTGSPNVACWNPETELWEEMAGGRVATGYTAHGAAVCSFNHRLWFSLAVYDPGNGCTTSRLDALQNGQPRAWKPASAIISDMGEATDDEAVGFYKMHWDGTTSETLSGTIESMTVYQGRLYISGDFLLRAVKRGRSYTGPFVRQDPSAVGNEFYPCLPRPRGKPHAICNYEGGVVLAGKISKGLTDGGVLRNIGLWRAPQTIDGEGTWDSLGGGVNGEVWAVCVYQGQLYAAGDFTEAGGVEVKGLARWDGTSWNYVANFSDYGSVRAMCVAGDLLFIGGTFSRADGQQSLGVLCTWNGRSLGTAYTTLTAPDDKPFVRAMCWNGTKLYVGGWFDQIDLALANNIAYCTVTGSSLSAWAILPRGSPAVGNGITTGTVWSIGCMSVGGTPKVYVGTDKDSKAAGLTTQSSIWIHTPSTSSWTYISYVVWGSGPVKCIWSRVDCTEMYAGVCWSVTLPGHYETGGPKHQVVKIPSSGGITTIGGDVYCFDAPVEAICLTDAGYGEKVYVGASGSKTGGFPGGVGQPCQSIVAVGEDDRLINAAGGLGLAAYFAQFFGGTQTAVRMRTFQYDDQPCETLAVVGTFTTMNDGYCAQLAGLDLQGALVGVRGGVGGSWLGSQTGAIDGPYDMKAVPRSEWPDHWSALPCDPDEKFRWIICGSFNYAWNNDVRECDAETASEYFIANGLVSFAGGYMMEAIPAGQWAAGLLSVVECYDNKIVVAGAEGGTGTPPRYYHSTGETSWEFPWFVDPWEAGGLNGDYSGQFNALIRWEGLLFVLGHMQIYPDLDTGQPSYVVATWNKTAYAGETPTGYPSTCGINACLRCATVVDLGDGEYLYCGGQADDPDATCPVVKRDKSGTWSSVGGDSKLRGICHGLAGLNYAEGKVLVAVGVLSVPDGIGGWTPCQVAKWDGTSWTAIGWVGLSDLLDRPCIVADCGGMSWADSSLKRVLVGGNLGEISDASTKVGTSDATQIFGLAQWNRTSGWSRSAGVNGMAFSAGSAQRILFPTDPPP